jgi:uncharacterized membrane protein
MKVSDVTSSIRDFIRAADIGRSRSSSVNQLQWTMAMLIAGMVLLQLVHAPTWLSVFLAIILGLDAVVFLGAFLYFMLKRPHSLRSESFDFKMAELMQRRTGEMDAGLYEEVSASSDLKVQLSHQIRHTLQETSKKRFFPAAVLKYQFLDFISQN